MAFPRRTIKFLDVGLVYFEPKELFLSKSQQRDVANGLASGDVPFPIFLFGREDDNPRVYCKFLESLTSALREGPIPPAPLAFRARPMLLQGHPLRVFSLEDAAILASDSSDLHDSAALPLTIPRLREHLNVAQSDSNIRCSQQLGQALIRRFWNLCHEDDLYEAIWVLSDTLKSITKDGAHIYRHLETLLDLSTALFFRFQLLQCNEDLDALLSLLEQQKEIVMKSELCWIWQKGGQERNSNMLHLRLFPSPALSGNLNISDSLIARIFKPNTYASEVIQTHRRDMASYIDHKNSIVEWRVPGRSLCPSPANEDSNATLHGSSESLQLHKTHPEPVDSAKPSRKKRVSLIFKRLVNALRLPQSKPPRPQSALPPSQQKLEDLMTQRSHHRLTGFNIQSHSPAISDNTLYEEVRGTGL